MATTRLMPLHTGKGRTVVMDAGVVPGCRKLSEEFIDQTDILDAVMVNLTDDPVLVAGCLEQWPR